MPEGVPLPWYQAYNASKHNRQQAFERANLWTLVEAVAGLIVVISAQFKWVEFDAGPNYMIGGNAAHYPFEHTLGSLFLIKYPDDWTSAEFYDFNWSELKHQPTRFQKFDYNKIET